MTNKPTHIDKDYSESETWFIAGPDDLQFEGRKKGKFYKRIATCTPWKKFKDHGTSGQSSEHLHSKYTEISRKEFLEHKCIDCWHPNGVEHAAALVPESIGVGDGTDGYDGYC